MSHLLQMRGLKLAPTSTYRAEKTSHLLQMRGLKRIKPEFGLRFMPSHLLQMRSSTLAEERESLVSKRP